MDECRAKCNDHSLQIWFECECPLNRHKCQIKCSHMYDEKNCIPHEHIVKEKEFVYYHTPNVLIYDQVHKNSHSLHKLHDKMDYNTQINRQQNQMIQQNQSLINQGLNMQRKAAKVAQMHSNQHKNMMHEIKYLKNGQDMARQDIGSIGEKVNSSLEGLGELRAQHGELLNSVSQNGEMIMKNKNMIGEVISNQAQHHQESRQHSQDLNEHRANFAAHREEFGVLRNNVAAHDAKLSGLVLAHNAHDRKQSEIMKQQKNTQQMVKEHDQNLANFEVSASKFIGSQMEANKATLEHNSAEQEFMGEQRDQNEKTNAHMAAEKEHMQLEKIHMVSNNNKHHHTHYYNKDQKQNYSYKNKKSVKQNVELVTKRVSIKKSNTNIQAAMPVNVYKSVSDKHNHVHNHNTTHGHSHNHKYDDGHHGYTH